MNEDKAPELPPKSAEGDIWQTNTPNPVAISQAKPIRKPMMRKRRTWGFQEVILSVVALFSVQALFLIIIALSVTKDLFGEGIEDSAVIEEAVMDRLYEGQNLAILLVMNYVVWLGTMLYATYFKGLKSFAKDFWVRFRWLNDLAIGLAIAVVIRGAEMILYTTLQDAGVDLSGAENTSKIVGQEGIYYFLVAILFASIIGPIMEELFFRGLLLQAFLRNFRRGNISGPKTVFGETVLTNAAPLFNGFVSFRNWTYRHRYVLSAVFSGLIFGMVHWSGEPGFVPFITVIETGLIGILFAFIVIKTKRLGITIFAHCFFNLSGVIMATLMQ